MTQEIDLLPRSSVADTAAFEAVERKGLDHPDTICDALFEETSLRLSHFLFAALGHIRFCLAHRRARPWTVILFATMATASIADPIDPHALFETRCSRCHQEHAGDFARETLLFEEGDLIGRKSGKRVLDFLPKHHGKLTSDEVRKLVEAFELQVRSDGLYREKCRICHDPATTLARRTLVLRNELLIGRYTDRDIKRLLAYHGRLGDEQQMVIYDMLVWQVTTIEGQDAD